MSVAGGAWGWYAGCKTAGARPRLSGWKVCSVATCQPEKEILSKEGLILKGAEIPFFEGRHTGGREKKSSKSMCVLRVPLSFRYLEKFKENENSPTMGQR